MKEKILSSSCIEDVIGDFVQLRRSGLNYRGLSPFSREKNPSFIVSPIKKIWKDFSSGKGGNIITFLMEHEHFSYEESLSYLAKKYHIELYNEEFHEKNENDKNYDKLYTIQKYAKYVFIKQLYSTKEGKDIGLDYLIQKRGFKSEIIQEFQLGYALNYWRTFTEEALKKGFILSDLIKSGLTVPRKNNNHFDRFRKRIMFPIHDWSGKIIGFGGRNIDDGSCHIKYMNSSESDIFQKGKTLYGLFQSKKYILKENLCYLVEGYTDVISLHQSGIKNVVSSSGVSLTIYQISLIKKFTKNIIIFYDGDYSGIKASLRSINMILEQGMNLRLLSVPKGYDPDLISKQYSHMELKHFLDRHSYNFISFKKKIFSEFYSDDPVKKSFLVDSILHSISKIWNLIQRELFLQEASRILNIRQDILIFELERINKKQSTNRKKSIHSLIIQNSDNEKYNFQIKLNNHEKDVVIFLEKKLIELILNHGNKTIKIDGKLMTVFERLLHFFKYWKISFISKENQNIFLKKSVPFTGQNQNKKWNLLSKWKKKGIQIPSEEDHLHQYVDDILLKYKSLYILKLIQKEIDNIKHINNSKCVIKKIMYLTNMKNKIFKKLHRYV